MFKVLRVLVLSLCLVLCICSCKTEVQVQGTQPVNTAVDGVLGVPLTADYGGAKYRVLSAGNVAYADFTAEEDAVQQLDIAQYERKKKIEANYNVEIIEDIKQGTSSASSGKPGHGYTIISNHVASGTAVYDACLIAGYDVSVLAYQNLLFDMNSVSGIDLNQSWWDQKANDSLAVHDLVFFSVGDYTLADNDAAYVIMFNKKILEDYKLESPYEMVANNTWTLENFASLCKKVTVDLDSNSVMDENDRYGLLVWVDSLLGMVNAAGQRCCVIDENGQIKLTLNNETTLATVEQFLDIALNKQYALQYQSLNGYEQMDLEKQLWSGDHGLFWTTYMGNVPRFRDMESNFGILPYPKLNSSQDNYYSTVTPFNSQFVCFPLVQKDINMAGVVTEALAYYGQKDLLPEYYDVRLKGKTVRDSESSEMLDIIFDNLVYDIGYIYQIGEYNKDFNRMVSGGRTSNFSQLYETNLLKAESQLETINEAYAQAVAKWKK